MTGGGRRVPRREAALRSFARFGASRPRATVAAVALLAAVSAVGLPGLRLEGNTSRLVPTDDRVGRSYRRSEELFGESNPLVLRLRGGDSPAGARPLIRERARAVRDELADWPGVREAYLLPPREVPDLAARLRAAVRNGDPGARAELLRRLEPAGIRRQLLRTRKRLVSATGPGLREAIAGDPLGVGEILEAYYAPRGLASLVGGGEASLGGDPPEPLLLLYPAGSAEDGVFCRRLMGRIGAAVAAAGSGTQPDGTAGFEAAGVHAVTAQMQELVTEDMGRITLIALVLLLAVLGPVFGDPRMLVVVFVPLIVAQLLLLAAARWLFNPIHFLTVGSVAVVLGMGVDVSLHLAARYRDLLAELPWRRAVEESLVECVPPLTVGTITTIAVFLALVPSRSPGLVELGLLTAVGLTASLLCTVLFFPGLVAAVRSVRGGIGPGRLRWVPRRLPVVAARRPGAALALAALVVAGGILLGRGLELDLGVESLLPRELPALETARDLRDRRGMAVEPPLLVTLSAPTLERGLEAQRRLDRSLVELVASGAVSRFRSPSELLAAPADDRESPTRPPDLTELARSFSRLTQELGLRPRPGWPGYLESVRRAVSPDGVGGAGPGPPAGISRFLATAPGGAVHLQTYVTPGPGAAAGTWMDPEPSRRVASALEELDPGEGTELTVTGILPVYLRVNELVRSDVARVGLAGGLLVVGVILISFRDWRWTVAALLPLVAAVPLTLGILVAAGATVTPITLCFAAVVLGIGIDDAVHVLWRLRGPTGRDLPTVMGEVGPLLALTTVSSVIGFGSLVASRVPVVASMGLAVAVGVAACWVFTLLVLPWASRWIRGRAGGLAPLLVVPLAGLAALSGAPLGAEPPPVDSVLAEIERRAEEVEAVEASFRLVRSVPELTAPVELEGWLFFQRPRSVEVRLRGAENLDLLSDGERLWWIDRDLEEVEALLLEAGGDDRALARRMPLLLLLSPGLPRDELEVTVEEPERARHRIRVEAREPWNWGFTELVMELDRRYRLVWLRSEDGSGGWSEYHFEGWHRRGRRAPETFGVPSPLPDGWWESRAVAGSQARSLRSRSFTG